MMATSSEKAKLDRARREGRRDPELKQLLTGSSVDNLRIVVSSRDGERVLGPSSARSRAARRCARCARGRTRAKCGSDEDGSCRRASWPGCSVSRGST